MNLEITTYEELRTFLRKFASWAGEHVYDCNGVVHLLLALLDNLQENAVDVELKAIGDSMTPSQRAFLAKLAEYAARSAEN